MKYKARIAIVTLYDDWNIGNKLQNYAVQKILSNYCELVVTMTYSEAMGIKEYIGIKGRIVAILGYPSHIANQKRLIIRRYRKFKEFSNKYINALPAKSFANYTYKDSEQYDFVVVGSDQVWHNWNNTNKELEYFFLKFAPREKRICLSPSFGLKNITKEYYENYVEGLMGFENLSCRETDGCSIIKKLTNRDAELLIDPTMFLTTEEWDRISKKPNYEIPSKYILVYFLGNQNDATKSFIRKLSMESDMPVLDIFNIDEIMYYDTSPDEFLYLIKHANAVCTNSYHCCVFSILYHKKLYSFDRIDAEGNEMIGRQTTLFEKFGFNKEKKEFEVPSVEHALEIERKKFTDYLEKCMNSAAKIRS